MLAAYIMYIFSTWLTYFLISFYTGFMIKQKVFDKDIPTPLLLYEFLQMLPVALHSAAPDDDDDDFYNPWKESDDAKVNNVFILYLLDIIIYSKSSD